MEVLQIPSELEQMRELYRERKPKRVLEIGSWDGGTLREWLTQEPDVIVSVDIDHSRLLSAAPEIASVVTLITGDSTAEAIRKQVQAMGPYDWMFVDGDHDEWAVRIDVETCLACAAPKALLVMHDITAAAGYPETGPHVMLEELRRSGHEVRTFTDEPGSWRWAHGIGVVQL